MPNPIAAATTRLGVPQLFSIVAIVSVLFFSGCASTPGRETPLGMVVATAFSPDGKTIAAATSEGEIALFDSQPLWFRRLLSRVSDKQAQPSGYAAMIASIYRPIPLAYSVDGRLLAAAGIAGSIVVWETATGDEKFRVAISSPTADLAFLPDGQRLVVAGPEITIRSTDNGAVLATIHQPGEASATAVAVSPDGRQIVAGLANGELAIFNASNYALQQTLPGHQVAVTGVAFAPDGRVLASTAGGYDLRQWERQADGSFVAGKSPVAAAASAEETLSQAQGLGTLLWLLGTARGIQMVGAPTLGAAPNISAAEAMFIKAAKTAPHHCGSRVAFSADGRYLAATANLMLCADCIGTLSPPFLMFVTELATGKTVTVRDTGCAVSLSPDGRTVVTGGSGAPQRRRSESGETLPNK